MEKKNSLEVPVEKRRPHALYTPDNERGNTKQSFKEECDINTIYERARNGQDISRSINTRVAQYGDFTNIPDFREACDLVIRANGMFMELDPKVRERFANDPARLIDFLQNPENKEEAIKLGLIAKEPKAPEAPPATPATQATGGTPGATSTQAPS